MGFPFPEKHRDQSHCHHRPFYFHWQQQDWFYQPRGIHNNILAVQKCATQKKIYVHDMQQDTTSCRQAKKDKFVFNMKYDTIAPRPTSFTATIVNCKIY